MQAFQPCLRSFQPQSCEQVKRFLLDDSLLTKTVSRSQNTGVSVATWSGSGTVSVLHSVPGS